MEKFETETYIKNVASNFSAADYEFLDQLNLLGPSFLVSPIGIDEYPDNNRNVIFDLFHTLQFPLPAENVVGLDLKNTWSDYYHPLERQQEASTECRSNNMCSNITIPSVDYNREENLKQIPVQQNLMFSNNAFLETLHGDALSYCTSRWNIQTVTSKRKRSKRCKNGERHESQRMIHIAVERNRRKQMNEHLKILRSLMPSSYALRGDQASIVGAAIDFVKELEEILQCLESQKRQRLHSESPEISNVVLQSSPISPQVALPWQPNEGVNFIEPPSCFESLHENVAELKSPVGDIEVQLVETDAMIRILSQRRPGQLLKTIAGLENSSFTILHTNITTIEPTVLYSFSVKVNAEEKSTAKEIAICVQQILIQVVTTC